ncbi:MAG TPA: alpha/beta hydrolase [Chitinophagaceae bacterium]|nr:alpha/beta hydrolase [Chitinophagaceae bacterium]
MRKLFLLGLLAAALTTRLVAQDMDKVRKDYQKILSAKTGVPYGHNPAAGKYYNIRGFRMYCEVYGKGQPLLIIHGNGGSINNFIYQIPYFARKYKVIIADSRSQGRSADPGNDSLTYEMMADDYAALLDALKIDSADVIGWSDGGINGLLLAIRHPQKVRKLAVTGANLVPDTTAVPQEIWDMVDPPYQQLANKNPRSPKEENEFKLLNLLRNQPHIPYADLEQIQCPTLVIGGDHDVIRPEHTLQIFSHIPHAYLWILPASGHSTPIVYKEDFNRVVDRFFSTPFREIRGAARFF